MCWWPPMFANQRCYTYIPWTPSTFLRSHCLIGLSFSWNVRLDSFVSTFARIFFWAAKWCRAKFREELFGLQVKAEIQDISVRLNRQQHSFVNVYAASFPRCPEAGRRLLKLVVCFTALLKFVGPWRSNLRSDGPSYLLFGKRGEKDASY